MANFNRVYLLGNLTRDLDVRYTQSGLTIGKFGMAINRKSKSKDGESRESVCFVDCTAFGKTAEVLAQYVGKGSPLFVEGRLEYSQWETQEGQKRSKLEVIVEQFQFLGSGKSEGKPQSSGKTERVQGPEPGEPDYSNIPF